MSSVYTLNVAHLGSLASTREPPARLCKRAQRRAAQLVEAHVLASERWGIMLASCWPLATVAVET